MIFVAENVSRARRLERDYRGVAGLGRLHVRYAVPGATNMRGFRFQYGDRVVFDDCSIVQGEPPWGILQVNPAMLPDGMTFARLDDLRLEHVYEAVPSIGKPPIHDPVALARWLLF